jgi:hypothetical protein
MTSVARALRPPALDLAAFDVALLEREPFDHLIAPRFLSRAAQAEVLAEFPVSDHGGVEPARATRPGGALDRLLGELRDPDLTRRFAEKFGVALDPETLMITMRSRCRPEDGKIHTDSTSKVVTALIYLEPEWTAPGGRLRLLRGPDNLDDAIAEAAPVDGTLLAFRRTDNSWHGHAPHEGVRRTIMLNWMVSPAAARRETGRHQLSANVKRLLPKRRAPTPPAGSLVVEAASARAARRLRGALDEARRDAVPFRHWTVGDVLPHSLYTALRDLDLGSPTEADGSGRRETQNAARLFFDPAVRAASPAAKTFAAAFQDPETVAELEFLTGARLDGSYLRIEYCLDVDGFWLEPHTDIAAKRITMLIYLSDTPGCDAWGTDLLDKEGRLVKRPRATPNSAVIFVPASDTWHGFARRPIEGVRRTLIVNYVAPNWRATHEFAYPLDPVRSAWPRRE